MTPQDHNKVIGIMHLVYGGFNALTLVILVPIFAMMFGFINLDPGVPGEVKTLFWVLLLFILLMAFAFAVPPILAGYGLLKRRSWARTAAIVSAIFAAISFPFGTALCVYTLWFFFGEEGKKFYDAPYANATRPGALPHASTFGWDAQGAARARQGEYAPPPQPPNWRDEV